MATIKFLRSKSSRSQKSSFEYELYKYEDIQSNWIIHQGYLQYLYSTSLLGDSLFKIYRVVLARIPIENMADIIGLYLYVDEKKALSYFLPIDEKIGIKDRCNRNIRPEPKYYLFELNFNDKDKPDIFGAKDNIERQMWVEKLKSVVTTPKPRVPDCAYLLPKLSDKPIDDLTPDPSPNYPSFDPNERFNSSKSTYSFAEPIDYSQSSTTKPKQNSSFCLNHNSSPSQEKTFSMNDIFYSNEKDDYKYILAKTGECGAFLIRPQSKKTSSNDHDYTLCMYDESNNVRCFGIYELPTHGNEYSLTRKGSKSFVDMVQLCQYYTKNPLPTSVNNPYLKKPYKYYENKFQ